MPIFDLLGSAANATVAPSLEVFSAPGIITLVVGIALVVAAFYIVYKVLKNVIANAIIGGVGLILMHFLFPFLFGFEVSIGLMNILIALIAGLPGLVIVIVLSLFGIR